MFSPQMLMQLVAVLGWAVAICVVWYVVEGALTRQKK